MENPLLSKRLYEETQAVHEQVESSDLIVALRNLKLSQEDYVQYLVDLKSIYEALEHGMRTNENIPALHELFNEKLCRTCYLEKDIQSFGVVDVDPSSVANEYVQHLKELSERTPLLLIAHAYVRYMGDLSGGRMMKKFVDQCFPGNHSEFYNFDTLLGENATGSAFVEYKNSWKEALDTQEFIENDKIALVNEAKKAFEFAGRLLKKC